ncbi:MAG TPA: hypothetical protein VGP07_22035 [Polyangia bacterium]
MSTGEITYQVLISGQPDNDLTSTLIEARVSESIDGMSAFDVRFAIDLTDTSYELVDDPRLSPGQGTLLTLLVFIDGDPQVLVHGPITDRQLDLRQGGPGSALQVSGYDRRIEMDRNWFNFNVFVGSSETIAQGILSSYFSNVSITVEGEKYSPDATDGFGLVQTVSDLRMVEQIARAANGKFWIDWTFNGGSVQETAHVESVPPLNSGLNPSSVLSALSSLLPIPQPPTLKMNAGNGLDTILSMRISRPTEIPNQGSGDRVNISDGSIQSTFVGAPTQPPLGAAPPSPGPLMATIVTAGSIDYLQPRLSSALNDASFSTRLSCETTAHALAALLRPRQLVNVSGTGTSEDGQYLVWAVNHSFDPADHRMTLTLARNAVKSS